MTRLIVTGRRRKWPQRCRTEALLAAYMDSEPTLRSNAMAQIELSGFPSISVAPGDVVTNQMILAAGGGLPANLGATLMQLGADSATVTNIQDSYLSLGANAVPGSFPQSLSNPALDSAFHNAATDLRNASLVLINLISLPSGQVRFDLPTEPGYAYSILFSRDLGNPASWVPLLTTNASANLISFTNAPSIGSRAGFYRASHN